MSLAVKHRPKKFEEVVGQDIVIRAFKRILSSGSFYPAYILAGPLGTGKTTLARLLAKAGLCSDRGVSPEPCNSCESCKMFDLDRHPCFQEIDAASHGLVDNVRRIRQEALLTPPAGYNKRFLIIDEAHMLTRQAQNAFLKILEEGSRSTVFILATTDPEKILPTVRSRCQVFFVRKPPISQVVKRLVEICEREGLQYNSEALTVIASASKGFLRNAITSLEMCIVDGTVDLDEVKRLFNLDVLEKTASVLLRLHDDRATALKDLQKLLESSSVKDISSLMCNVISDSVLHSLGCQIDTLPAEILSKIHATFGRRAEMWVSKLSKLETPPELFVVLNSLFDRTIHDMSGPPKTYDELMARAVKRRNEPQEDEPLTEEDVMGRLESLGFVDITSREDL